MYNMGINIQRYSQFGGVIGLALLLMLGVVSCGVKVQEQDAKRVMKVIYKARKNSDITKELKYYAKKDFKIVPFDEVKGRLQAVLARAGRLKKVKALETKTQRRNQLGDGLVTYMILSYKVTYTNMTLEESYYFLGSSKKPKLVYMTLQL